MRRRVMMVKSGGKNKLDIVAGDILCAKEDGSKAVFDKDDYYSIPSSWTPIGVVVIPPSHDVYGTGEGAAMSLKYMDPNNPDMGAGSQTYVKYGQSEKWLSLPNYTYANTTDNKQDEFISITTYVYLPSDKFTSIQCTTDPIAYYNSDTYKAPSPYISDGSRNPSYYGDFYDIETYNAFSDFDGKGNSDFLLSIAVGQMDWKLNQSIWNYSGEDFSPAACCCWRYHTVGTNQGDWYVPAIGELGYFMPRYNDITTTMNHFNMIPPVDNNGLISSTEYSDTQYWGVWVSYGSVYQGLKSSDSFVIAFTRF